MEHGGFHSVLEKDHPYIFIDTTTPMFYQCSDGAWVAFSPPPPATEE